MLHARFQTIFRFGLLLLAALVLGALLDHVAAVMLFALFAYIGWQLYWLFRMERWLAHERSALPPEAPGIWGEIFHQLYAYYRRNRQRKHRIARLMRAFRDSTAAMPEGVVALNPDGQIVWFNDAGARLLGLARQQDVGQRIVNLLRNPVFVRYLTAEDYREPVELASPIDADRRLSLHVAPYGEGERLLLVRDVTRLHRLEQMRREFVANASHELRSPLTVISGYLEALEGALHDDEHLRRDWGTPVGEMRRQAERMSGIIADLLELSRLETAGDPADGEVIDVRGLLARIREEALALGEGPRDVRLEFATDVRLRGVEREIYSAFSNLVFNAMRYTPRDGSVTLCWRDRSGQPSLSVVDTGIGIAREHIPRITERFYRVEQSRVRSKGGTGLGLAIVKHVLQRHGAKLVIRSVPGEGSDFTCIFPAHRGIATTA